MNADEAEAIDAFERLGCHSRVTAGTPNG